MNYDEFARLCLDPARLAVLGRSAEGTLDAAALSEALGISRRDALMAIAHVKMAEVIDGEGRLRTDSLWSIARTLPKPEEASPAITHGDWTQGELAVLRTFFSGDRLVEIPANHAKRRIVLERLAQEFEPGSRYSEKAVSDRLGAYHEDYAALRRYLVDERILARADGVYWRSGGRFPMDLTEDDPDNEHPALLETERRDVVLAPFADVSAKSLVSAANDERIARTMTDGFPFPYTLDDAADWIERARKDDPPLHFAVLVDGILAGGVGCEPKHDINSGSAEIGWWVNPAWWGKGVATVAVDRFIRFCFDDLSLYRIEAGIFLTNPASARVADKCGMVLEGVSRDAYVKHGVRVDRLSYGLARSQRDQTR